MRTMMFVTQIRFFATLDSFSHAVSHFNVALLTGTHNSAKRGNGQDVCFESIIMAEWFKFIIFGCNSTPCKSMQRILRWKFINSCRM